MFRSKIFAKFMVTYIAMLLVPMTIISGLVYSKFVNKLSDEVMNSTKVTLSQLKDVMDINLKDLERLSTQVSMNPDIIPLLSYQRREMVSAYPDIYKAINELHNYKFVNSIIDSICLFLRDSDVIISDRSKYTYKDYFFKLYNREDTEEKQLYEQLNSVNDVTIQSPHPVNADYGTLNLMTYMHPLPVGSSSYTTTLVITVNESVIRQLIQKVLGDYSGYIVVMDSSNNKILGTDLNKPVEGADNTEKILDEFIKEAGDMDTPVFSQRLGEHIVSYVRSDTNGWKYITIMNTSQIFDKINYVKRLYIIAAAITLLIGVLLAYYFSRGNYSNVKKITDIILSNRDNTDNERYTNEWYLINNTINKYISDNTDLQKRLAEQMPILKNNFFMRLLKGDLSDANIVQSMLDFLKIKIDRRHFAVILLAIDDYDNFVQKNSEPAQDVIRVTIATTAEQICSESGFSHALEIDKERLAVVVTLGGPGETEFEHVLAGTAGRICSYIMQSFMFNVTTAVSNIHDSILELGSAYEEAQVALDYRLVKGENTVICYWNLGDRIGNMYYYSFEQEKQIVNHLRIGDYESIEKILSEIVQQVKNNPVSLDIIKCMYFDIVNTAIKSLHELGISGGGAEINLAGMMRKKTLDEMYEEVCRFYNQVCGQVNKSRQGKGGELRNNAIDFIIKNYHDSNLSVEMVADEFSVTPSYMSRVFKEQVGCNFVDYLHNIRLTRAKKLLSGTQKTIGEIAEETGYNSAYNFTRVFKRYEGINPTDFRAGKVV